MIGLFHDERAADPGFCAGGVMAESFGPSAVTVAFIDFTDEPDFAAGSNFLLKGAEVGAKILIVRDAERAIFKSAAKAEPAK